MFLKKKIQNDLFRNTFFQTLFIIYNEYFLNILTSTALIVLLYIVIITNTISHNFLQNR